MREFLKEVKIVRCSNGASAGTSLVTSSAVDMNGYQAVAFVASLGTVVDASVLTLTAYENTSNSASGGTAISGGATSPLTASTSSNTDLVVDCVRPADRYVYCTLARTAQNATVNAIYALLYRAQQIPVSQPATVAASASSNPEA